MISSIHRALVEGLTLVSVRLPAGTTLTSSTTLAALSFFSTFLGAAATGAGVGAGAGAAASAFFSFWTGAAAGAGAGAAAFFSSTFDASDFAGAIHEKTAQFE